MKNNQYFCTDAENGFGKCLVLTGDWHSDYVEVIKSEKIQVLRLSESMGWKSNDISFLNELQSTDLKGIDVFSWRVKDITPLSCLKRLESIGLQCEFTKAPDFSAFENLSHASLLWRPKASSLLSCSDLVMLNIMNFPNEDLTALGALDKLETLKLTSKKLSNLNGVEKLSELKELDLADCSKLISLSQLELCGNIHSLALDGCKGFLNMPMLKHMNSLSFLSLNDCGKLNSLVFLDGMESLLELSFFGDTNIEDGDVKILASIHSLKSVKFTDRKHYNAKRKDLDRMLKGKTSRIFSLFG